MTTSILFARKMFAKCVDDPQALELLEKFFQQSVIKQSKKLKKKNSNNNHEKRKIN